MLSRVADAIYWSSRYVERAENAARLVEVSLGEMLDTPVALRSGWEALVLTTGDHEWYVAHYGEVDPTRVAWFLTFDKTYPNSVISAISAARENAQTVREAISREMWHELNELYLMVREASRGPFSLMEMGNFYARLKLTGMHYEGVTNATLSRGEAWHFARLGRVLERADKISRILDVKCFNLRNTYQDFETSEQGGWTALLDSVSGLQMYRQLYQVLSPTDITAFLLLNRQFPRSIHYCAGEARRSLRAIADVSDAEDTNEPERLLGRLQAQLSYSSIADVMTIGLHEYIDGVQAALNRVGTVIQQYFLDYRLAEA
jgi:uncharacterized alpha-E superfamily protein